MKKLVLVLFCFAVSILYFNFVFSQVIGSDTSALIGVKSTILTIFDDTDNETRFTGDNVNFFANYTNTTGGTVLNATCSISYNLGSGFGSTSVMIFNSSSLYYENRSSFSTPGNFNFNVTCVELEHIGLQAVDSFTISSASVPDRGGEGPLRLSFNLSDSGPINIEIKQGGFYNKTLIVTNTGEDTLIFDVLIKDIISLLEIRDDHFSLESGENILLTLEFMAAENEEPGLYQGNILFESNSLTEIVFVNILVIERLALLDMNVKLNKEKLDLGEDKIESKIRLIKLGEFKSLEGNLKYSILNQSGSAFTFGEEIISFEDEIELVRSLPTSELPVGNYIFYTQFDYLDGKRAVAANYFSIVQPKSLKEMTKIVLSLLILLLIILILIMLLIREILKRKKSHN